MEIDYYIIMSGFSVKTTFKCQNSVIEICSVGENILFFDASYNLLKVGKQTLKSISKTAIQKDAKPKHEYSKSVSISKSEKMLLALEGGKTVFSLSIAQNSLSKIGGFEYFKGEVISTAFSPTGSFCMSGSTNGEIALFDPNRLIPLGHFDKQGDYISQISISPDESYAAVSLYDKRTIIYNLADMSIHMILNNSNIVERSTYCNKVKAFVLITRGGQLECVSVEHKKTIFHTLLKESWLTDIVTIGDGCALISTRAGELILYDLIEKQTLKELRPYESVGISRLHLDDKYLYIGFSTGDIFVVDINDKLFDFEAALKIGDLIRADALCEQNIFLTTNKLYRRTLKELWEAKKNEAAYLMVKQKPDEAYLQAKPFLRIKSLKNEFEDIISQSAEMGKFYDAIEQKNYTKAYQIASNNKLIEKLDAYSKLENIFCETLKSAISLLEEDETKNKTAAISLLKPFAAVPSKKEIILEVFAQWGRYKECLNYIKSKNFKAVFELAERYKYIQQTTIYKKTLAVGEGILQKLTAAEAENRWQTALEFAKILSDFKPFSAIAKAKSTDLQTKALLVESIKKYEQREISLSSLAVILDRDELAGFEARESFLNGIRESIMSAYNEYGHSPSMFIPKVLEYTVFATLKNHILTLIRESYLQEINIESAKPQAAVDWQSTFDRLAINFEIDAKTESLALKLGAKVNIKERSKHIDAASLPSSIIVFRK